MLALLYWVSVVRDTAIVIATLSGAAVGLAGALRLPVVRRVFYIALTPLRWVFGHAVSDTADAISHRANAWLIRSELGAQMKTMHHEMTPNNGSSIKDAVARMESRQLTMETSQERNYGRIVAVEKSVSENFETLLAVQAETVVLGERVTGCNGGHHEPCDGNHD